MFTASTELYDIIYSHLKDYREEARQIAAFLQDVHPRAKRILDVACGTGEHARLLSQDYGYVVDGIDLDPAFVRIAQAKHPEGTFVRGDMQDFDLGRTYDVVMCLFSSIGYVKSLSNVERTLANFRAHLAPEGIVLVEPWLVPEEVQTGFLHMACVDEEDLKICRMSQTEVDGRISRVRFEYLVGRAEGLSHRSEVHELGLFTQKEMRACFAAAGFEVDYDEAGFCGRGLYVGRVVA